MKKRLPIILFILVFLVGLSVLLYPTVSNYINTKNASRVIAGYSNVVDTSSEERIARWFEEADEYNRELYETPLAFYQPDLIDGYSETLDITGTGIMGYISIPKIKVYLPIYHTVDEGVIQIAVGHMPGTSLPVGGENTHCVLSGHRGLPSARLFTDLPDLEIGDTFTITVVTRILTYEVDQIKVVLPTEADDLQIIPGGDYCTLVTCTPYGINSHRLLVRGKRIETVYDEAEKANIYIPNEAFRIDTLLVTPIVAVPMLLFVTALIIIWVKIKDHGKKKKKHR